MEKKIQNKKKKQKQTTAVSGNKDMTAVAAEEANELVRLHIRLSKRARCKQAYYMCAHTYTDT